MEETYRGGGYNIMSIGEVTMLVYVFKALGILAILFLAGCVINLYKVFRDMPDIDNNKGFVAFGMLAEIVLILLIASKLVIG